MKMNFIHTLAVTAALGFCSCTEIEDGSPINFDEWEAPEKIEFTLNHPCMLHSEAEFTYVKERLAASAQPWADAYTSLKSSKFANPAYQAEPVEWLKRLDKTNWESKHPDYVNYANLANDAAAAYQLALRWKLSDEAEYGDAAKTILNAWAKNCKGIYRENGSLIDPNELLIAIQAYQLANAAEILRGYDNWGDTEEFKAFVQWMENTFYAMADDFLIRHNNTTDHYWLNWDLAQMTAILSIGILSDNQEMINKVIQYFKNGIGPGNVNMAVLHLYDDPDGSGEKLGQCQESGRDQGHAMLCCALMGYFCKMAYNIGEDLFAYDNGRVVAMAEYVAKYNVFKPEFAGQVPGGNNEWFSYTREGFPYTSYFYCDEQMDEPSAVELRNNGAETGRGGKRPIWDLWYGHCKKVGMPAKYCGEFASRLRPDAGPEQYGGSGGALDQLGYSTLMFYYE